MQDSLDDSHFDSETLFTQSMGPFFLAHPFFLFLGLSIFAFN